MGMPMKNKRSESSSSPAGTPAAQLPEQWVKKHPNLAAWMTETSWEDGSVRVPSSVLFFCEDGAVKGMLNDRDAQAVAFVSGSSVDDCWALLERGLASDRLDWRRSKAQPARKRG